MTYGDPPPTPARQRYSDLAPLKRPPDVTLHAANRHRTGGLGRGRSALSPSFEDSAEGFCARRSTERAPGGAVYRAGVACG